MRGKIHILISRLLQTCVVASLLAGCTKVVPDDSFEQKSRIGFNTAMTKAAVGYPKESKFISTAYFIASTGSWDNASGTTIPYSESTPLTIPANGLSPYSELYLLPQLYPSDGGPSLEIKYTKRTYTGNNQYDYSEVTASVSFYDLFASTGHRLVINRNLTFNIVFNIDSNLITWAPDQQDWDGSDFKIDF